MTPACTTERTDWGQVVLAAVSQNVATSFAFGSFGTLVLAIEKEYGASRSSSSLAISLLVVSLAITASILGRALDRISIRKTMCAGAVLGSIGFILASLVQTPTQLLAVYLLVLGPATAMMGVLPCSALASNWSAPDRRGLALGIVNVPLLVMIVPLALAPLLELDGVRMVYRVLATFDVLLLPLLIFVRDPVRTATAAMHGDPQPPASTSALLASPRFWILVVAEGLIAGAGIMKLAHFVPLLTEQGRTFTEANTLLAISGGAGILGSFLFGMLADRVGGTLALVCNGLIQAAMWTIFLAPVSFGVLVADAVIVGACGAGVQSAFSVALHGLFGARSFNIALGFASLFALPFLFGLTPLASLLYQASGNYHLPMGMMVGGFVLSAVLFFSQSRQERAGLMQNS